MPASLFAVSEKKRKAPLDAPATAVIPGLPPLPPLHCWKNFLCISLVHAKTHTQRVYYRTTTLQRWSVVVLNVVTILFVMYFCCPYVQPVRAQQRRPRGKWGKKGARHVRLDGLGQFTCTPCTRWRTGHPPTLRGCVAGGNILKTFFPHAVLVVKTVFTCIRRSVVDAKTTRRVSYVAHLVLLEVAGKGEQQENPNNCFTFNSTHATRSTKGRKRQSVGHVQKYVWRARKGAVPQKKGLRTSHLTTRDNYCTYHTVAIVTIAILHARALLAKHSFPQTNKRHRSINQDVSAHGNAHESTKCRLLIGSKYLKISENIRRA